MPGHRVIGRFATLDSSRVMCPEKPGSMKPAVEWVSRPRRPRLTCPPVGRPGRPAGSRLQRRAEHELARVQHERLPLGGLDEAGELVLPLSRVDVRVPGVVEDTEQAVEANVHAGRLNHLSSNGSMPSRWVEISERMSRSDSSTARG